MMNPPLTPGTDTSTTGAILIASLATAVTEMEQLVLRVALIAGVVSVLRLFRPGRPLPDLRSFLVEPAISSFGAVMVSMGVLWLRPEWPMAAHLCQAIVCGWIGIRLFDFVEDYAAARARKLLDEKADEEETPEKTEPADKQ